MAKKATAKKTAAKSKTAKSKPAKAKASKSKSTKSKTTKSKSTKSKAGKARSVARKSTAKTARKSATTKRSAAKKSASKKTAAKKTSSKSTAKAKEPAKTKASAKTTAAKPSKPKVKGTAAAAPARRRVTKRKSKKDIKTLRRKSGKLITENKVAGVGDKTVQAKTGNTWTDWFKIIDKAGGKDFDHRSIARFLYDSFPDLSSWWSQMITVGYEQTRGKRDKYQRPEGYAVNASKTIAAPVDVVYNAWVNAPKRSKWLPRVKFKISSKRENKNLRLEWQDKKTRVDVEFYERGLGKSQITVQHRKLPDAKRADEMKTYWRERLAVLASQMRDS